MTGPRQDNATLTEELLAYAQRLEDEVRWRASQGYVAEIPGGLTKQAALIRALVAEHYMDVDDGPDGYDSDPFCAHDQNGWPCPTLTALAACFLSSGSTVPGVTK